jgi:hypothetical protein
MANDRPDPGDFLEQAARMLRQLFDAPQRDDDPWAGATRQDRESWTREPSPEEQRENLTFALATRAVEALEDLALNVAAIRQRLERTGPPAPGVRPETEGRPSEGGDAGER